MIAGIVVFVAVATSTAFGCGCGSILSNECSGNVAGLNGGVLAGGLIGSGCSGVAVVSPVSVPSSVVAIPSSVSPSFSQGGCGIESALCAPLSQSFNGVANREVISTEAAVPAYSTLVSPSASSHFGVSGFSGLNSRIVGSSVVAPSFVSSPIVSSPIACSPIVSSPVVSSPSVVSELSSGVISAGLVGGPVTNVVASAPLVASSVSGPFVGSSCRSSLSRPFVGSSFGSSVYGTSGVLTRPSCGVQASRSIVSAPVVEQTNVAAPVVSSGVFSSPVVSTRVVSSPVLSTGVISGSSFNGCGQEVCGC